MQNVSGLTAATLGRSADLQVGQQVVAIGSPQGLTGTVTAGIVSALNRTVGVQGEDGSAVVYNGLQTDAPINQGNSGGPLVNLDGQVIGINSAIATAGQSSGSIGLGFTIPIDQARRVAQEILDTGSATKPVLGVQGGQQSTQQEQAAGGATIAAVQDGSAAATAGLKAGDVVTKVGDARVEDFSDLVARIGSYAPGDKVTLTVESGGAERTVDVTLGSTKDEAATTSTSPSSGNSVRPEPVEHRARSGSSRARSVADPPQLNPVRQLAGPRGPAHVRRASRCSARQTDDAVWRGRRFHVKRTGCPVDSSTAIHRSPRGSTWLRRLTASAIGRCTNRRRQRPTTISVRPDIAACTAACASRTQ